jgi:small-conductance mechanosensitive channel
LQAERREQRANAIGQLVRSAVSIVIWASAVMMILGQLGLNIAPLLASASVIGVALGFGAQTLVKDFLSGVFLILEDQFGVGDFVDLGDAVGTVEEVTLRVTRLRDTTGIVWYVRNGEILRVANRSQGLTLAIIDIPVGYNEDLDHVHEVVDATADAMVADPQCMITEFSKPTFAGVESVSGEAVYVRITAKSDPDDQVAETRLIRQSMKQAFDRAGIRVPAVYRVPGTVPGASGATAQTGSAPQKK